MFPNCRNLDNHSIGCFSPWCSTSPILSISILSFRTVQYFPIKKNKNKTLHKILHEFVSNLGNSPKH